jgi:hypothetical protein
LKIKILYLIKMNSNDNRILTFAEYGTILVPSKEVGMARGSGNWNPPPLWEQSTNRGPAYQNAYPLYVEQQNKEFKPKNPFNPEPLDVNNLDLAHFNTPSDLGDTLRKRVYQVGSTGLHSEPLNSWNNPEFEGAQNQYVEWALKALVQGGMTATPLVIYFFSTENVNYLQERTKQEIKKHTGTDINNQSVDELLIIMRNKILYAYSGWLPNEASQGGPNAITDRGEKPCSLENRIIRLNKSVLEETVKQVLSGINQYKQFIKDQSSLPMPLSLPVYASMSGSRELSESIGFNSGLDRTIAAQSFNQRYNIL